MARAIGVYGGSFDPVHNGHLRIAWEIYQQLDLAKVLLVPSHRPPHRAQPHASPQQRIEMLSVATADVDGFEIERCELDSSATSYTVHTLEQLRQRYGAEQPLALIMGGDAFMGIRDWHEWPRLLDLAHIIVAKRPSHPVTLNDELHTFFSPRRIDDSTMLAQKPSGYWMIQPVTQLDIASSTIRRLIASGDGARFLAPESVLTYVQQNNLYTDSL